MPLEAGVRLGTFEILEPLGAGGMGEVYRARDARLGRDVAIKILPEELARDPTRIARFEREARLLAAINHPGIAAIYGAEESDALRYIVLELVPGETLSEKLTRGALPLRESLDIGRQIADALDAAHQRGVVHRDLKPSNVKVTPEGKVKVLDFGLAKAAAPAPVDAASQTPTLVDDQTRPGVILGTIQFMSPEQARGREVDRRTDIWAFGCILFEMLSGRRAFTGETLSDVLASILMAEPEWGLLPPSTPPRVRELLERSLQKDPANRLRDAGDARMEIERAVSELSAVRTGTQPESLRRRRPAPASLAVAGAALLAALVAGWLLLRRGPQTGAPSGERSLVVFPSRDLSGLPGGQLVGDGLVQTLSARLGHVPGIQVVTPAAAVAAADGHSDPFRAAQTVGATLAVQSSLMRNGNAVRIAYSIWNVRNGTQIASGTVDGEASDLFEIQDRVAEGVAAGLRFRGALPRRPTPNGLRTAEEQERYFQALGSLQRYDRPSSVDAAIAVLEPLGREVPGSPVVDAALGRAYLYKFVDTRDRKWMELSRSACARAERSDSDLPEVAITRGDLNLAAGQAPDAVAAFQKALRAQPNNYSAILGLARALDASGETARAEATYNRALALQPAFWAGYSAMAAFDYAHGRYEAAAAMFRKVTELSPDNANAFSNLGAVYGMMGRFDQALEAYRKSLSLAPTDAAYSNVGTAEFYLGHYRESAEAFEKAIAITPGHFLFWANLGDAERWAKGLESRSAQSYGRAIALAREELKVNARDAHARAYLAVCLAKTGQSKEAEKQIRQSLASQPSNPELLYIAGVVSHLAGRRGEALEKLQQAVRGGFSAAIVSKDPELGGLKSEDAFRKIVRMGT